MTEQSQPVSLSKAQPNHLQGMPLRDGKNGLGRSESKGVLRLVSIWILQVQPKKYQIINGLGGSIESFTISWGW